MTKKELLTALGEFDDDAEIEIVVHQYNKHYPVAYVPIDDDDYPVTPSPHCGDNRVRIAVSLPKEMRTSVHKQKGTA